MAKIKFGSVITDSRGTVGGHTYTWTRSGNQLITKPQTAKLKTPLQSTNRANFAALTKNWWQLLTSTQRDEWRTLAAANPRPNVWGDPFPLTGLAMFISLNRRLNTAGESMTNDAPADQFVTPPSTATLTVAAPATVSIAFTPGTVPANHIAYLQMTGPISPGISNYLSKLNFVTSSSLGQTSPWDIATAYTAKYGDVLAGRQYAAALAFLNTDNAALSAAITVAEIAT